MIFRLLGRLAKWDARLGRIRINFIPLNFGVAAIVVYGAALGLTMITGGRANDTALILAVVCTTLAALLLTVRLRRHTIFRPVPESTMSGVDMGPEPLDLRVTGRLMFNAHTRRRFVDVPAEAMLLDTGEVALFSNIDGSSYYMGMRTTERAGLWSLIIPAGGMGPIVRGELSFGGEIRPAARLRITAAHQRSQTATLSFGSTAQRERFMCQLAQ